jgi:hypothetical protein
MATKTELRRMLLAELKVIGATTTAVPTDLRTLADLYIDGARATLLELGLCWWDEDDIPAAVSIPLVQYVAADACRGFGKAGKGHEGLKDQARKDIAALKADERRETVRQQYF